MAPNHKFSNDPYMRLKSQLDSVQQQLDRALGTKVTTVPLYDQDGHYTGDAVEGQVVIDPRDDTMKYRSNAAWHELTTSAIVTHGAFATFSAGGTVPKQVIGCSGTPHFAGLGYQLTPATTGKVVVTFVLEMQMVDAAFADHVIIGYGTGTPPAANDPATIGSTAGLNVSLYQAFQNITLVAGISGLSVGTQYWFDLRANGTTNVTLYNNSAVIFEVN